MHPLSCGAVTNQRSFSVPKVTPPAAPAVARGPFPDRSSDPRLQGSVAEASLCNSPSAFCPSSAVSSFSVRNEVVMRATCSAALVFTAAALMAEQLRQSPHLSLSLSALEERSSFSPPERFYLPPSRLDVVPFRLITRCRRFLSLVTCSEVRITEAPVVRAGSQRPRQSTLLTEPHPFCFCNRHTVIQVIHFDPLHSF